MLIQSAVYRGEVPLGHPKFSVGSKASCTSGWEGYPDSTVSNIEYSAEDDQIIEQFLRENINTTWHSLGTAKMAAREDKGAVDANLNVHGVGKLKVVDLSIVPENIGANTNNTALSVFLDGPSSLLVPVSFEVLASISSELLKEMFISHFLLI